MQIKSFNFNRILWHFLVDCVCEGVIKSIPVHFEKLLSHPDTHLQKI